MQKIFSILNDIKSADENEIILYWLIEITGHKSINNKYWNK